jgi:hypothetical protein
MPDSPRPPAAATTPAIEPVSCSGPADARLPSGPAALVELPVVPDPGSDRQFLYGRANTPVDRRPPATPRPQRSGGSRLDSHGRDTAHAAATVTTAEALPHEQADEAQAEGLDVAAWARRSRAAQGLPPKIEDEVVITRVLILAGLLRHPATRPRSGLDETPARRRAVEAQSP